jgi:hypothetical protein
VSRRYPLGSLAAVQAARTPEAAAGAILAHAAVVAAGLIAPPAERLRVVEEASARADALRRPWSTDGDFDPTTPPVRQWLREWGYFGRGRP